MQPFFMHLVSDVPSTLVELPILETIHASFLPVVLTFP